MALIDKDQVKAEIERMIKRESSLLDIKVLESSKREQIKKIELLSDLLTFLDTLQEQSVTDCHGLEIGLEEEISRTYHDGSVTDTEDIDHTSYENIARHFAEWGKNNLK